MEETWDCIIVGGGAAGLSAALVLGRARRKTLVVDAGSQSNLPAHGIGGLLGHDGRPPAELYEIGRKELSVYPSVEVRDGTVEGGSREGDLLTLELGDGSTETTRRVILAGGMEYRVEELPGIEELWGGSVFHCPFCHGWEVRDRPVAVRNNGAGAVHGALMLLGWTDDVVVLTDGPAEFTPDQEGLLAAAGVRVDERPLAGVRAREGELSVITFTDGSELEREGLMVAPRLHQRPGIVAKLGIKTGEANPMLEDPVEIDAFQRTSVPEVFAAGDLTGKFPQVASAIASGSAAAAFVVQTLLSEDHGLPLPPAMVEAPAAA